MEKEKVKQMLLGVDREGVANLVEALDKNGFFEAPASTRFHGNYKGGLIDHSYNIYVLFDDLVKRFNLQNEITHDSIVLCSLLHDVCKSGAYLNKGNGYYWNRDQPKGHATLSIKRIEKFIKLTDLEREIILMHMGLYQTKEFLGAEKGEYYLKELVGKFNNKLCKLFYFCDDMAAQFVDKKECDLNKDA
jgi:23S rRNA maturation-related 3'-5' exoribonuclease YhaM